MSSFLYSFWWLCASPSSVSWRCRGWGNCYPFINRCCSRCLLSRSAPTMIWCCWTQTICWSAWLLKRTERRVWEQRKEKGDLGYWQRIWTWWSVYFLSNRIVTFLWLRMFLIRNLIQISWWIKWRLKENMRSHMNIAGSFCLWHFSVTVCLSVCS